MSDGVVGRAIQELVQKQREQRGWLGQSHGEMAVPPAERQPPPVAPQPITSAS